MSRYAQPMSQVLLEMKLIETTDTKIVTTVNSLKKNDIIRVGFDSSIKKGHEGRFKVTAHNVIRGGRVTKTTLQNLANPKGVKHFIYQYQGKQGAYFAIGDMGASMTSLVKENLEEGYEKEVLNVLSDAGIDGYFRNGKLYVDKRDAKDAKAALEDADNIIKLPKMVKEEVEDLDEGAMKDLLIKGQDLEAYAKKHGGIDKKDMMKVAAMLKKGDKSGALKYAKGMDTDPRDYILDLMGEAIDPADVDDDATDADKKAADKNIIMQMRKAMDVKGNMKIEFGDGRKEKVDPKILQLMITVHGKMQKPRDKEKFVAMIGKSKRDMLNIAKKLSTLKAELDKDDVDTVMDVVKGLEKAVKTHQGHVATLKKDIKDENELDEAKLNIKKIHKAVDDGKSMDVIVGMFADKRTTNTDEIRKIVKDYMFKKRMKEETELEARVTSTAFRKKTARVNPMTQKDIERMVKDRKYKGNTSALMKDVKKKYPDEYESDIVQDMLQKHAETNEKLDEKYDLYHKSFSDAMQHAYDYAKRKMGITVDPKEIDNKVATGPKKPSEGKTNTYRLKGKGGNLQIQVYNKGGSKPFELNMYKEENEMKKSLKDTILEMRKEGFASDAQRKAAFASGYKEKDKKDKKEGVEEVDFFKGRTKDMTTEDKEAYEKFFNSALKKFGVKSPADFKSDEEKKKFFNYVDKNYKGENEKSEEVKESVERYLETKRGSLRDAVLQMWGEKHTPDHKEDEKNEKKTLTKEKKDGIKKMTDTGKEVTPVEVSVKMPKIKETKNKV